MTENNTNENNVLSVYWVGQEIGRLERRQASWSFFPKSGFNLSLSVINEKIDGGTVPFFLESLLPEFEENATGENSFNEFFTADRYVSNIVVRPLEQKGKKAIIIDKLSKSLDSLMDSQNQFTGKMVDMPQDSTDKLYNKIHSIVTDDQAPRMSGFQVKIPGNIDENGNLSIAFGKPFTHILKLPGNSCALSTMGAMEWFCMSVAQQSGVNTCDFCLSEIDGLGPVFIAERFDIQTNESPNSMILTEELCSCLGRTKNEKYHANMIDVANIILRKSTAPAKDAEQLLRQTVHSWIIGNSDMHLKNLMLLKHASEDLNSFSSIRLSPAYDIMHTILYPNGSEKSFALHINGEVYFGSETFRSLGKALKISASQTDTIVKETVEMIEYASSNISMKLPSIIKKYPLCVEHIYEATDFMHSRCAAIKMEFMQRQTKSKSKSKDFDSVINFGF